MTRFAHASRVAFLLLAALPPRSAEAQARTRQAPQAPQRLRVDSATFAGFKWRHIGPEGNRVSSVAGVAGDPSVYYAGAASGGIWKSTDGGVHWQPVFDDHPVQSIGALAVAPSDPNIVWAGTGEPFIRSNISLGWGVYKSTDAGKTWAKMGLDRTGRISRVIVDPRNPDVVFVAALGHAYGPQPERGVYRTTDGGKNWERVLYVNDSTGVSDLVMDPNNPRILFAGTWQIEIHTWGRTSGGAGSGMWTSRDGGTTWNRVTGSGLPTRHMGKVGLAMSRSNSGRIYALLETGDGIPRDGKESDKGRLFRSDDGGATWAMVSSDLQVAGRTHYYNRMAVSPDDADEAYFLTASWAKTRDGGRTIIDPPFTEAPGGDHHDIWIDPGNGNRMIVSHDVGASITTNRGKSWMIVQLPIAQMYHVTVDKRIPYFVYGNRQDGPSTRGPSNSKIASFFGDAGIPRGEWRSVGGGESGWATPDPADSNMVWSSASGFGSVGGIVTRHDLRTGITQNLEVWPRATIGWPADSLKYRFVWTFPLTISPHDPKRVFVGSQHVHLTTDNGQTWREVSPDLTRNDKSRQRISGGLTPDNIGVEYAGVVFAIAESPREAGTIWVGTNDGLVHLTRDGGATWTNLTRNIPGLLEWGTISNIEPSRHDAATAYLTVDGHQVNNRDPWVYRTNDYGRTWRLIVGGIAKSPLSYAHYVKEDPVKRGLLYLGTEGGLYASFDDGESWHSLNNTPRPAVAGGAAPSTRTGGWLPHAPVYGIAVQEHFNDLVVATYGRGFWVLDDITPLRELADGVASKDAHLFAPRAAYRFREVDAPFAQFYDPVVGQNPPYGAPINYWLKTAGKDSITVRIFGAGGDTVRTLKAASGAGVNRVWWNLRGEQTKEARIRNSPLYASDMRVSIEGRAAPGIGRVAELVPPGTYTVKATLGGQELSQQLVVRKDPSSGGSEDDIQAQTVALRAIKADLDSTVEMINKVEVIRGQLSALKAVLGNDSVMKDVRAAADSLDKKIIAVEENLLQMRVTGRGQDIIRWPSKLAEQLVYLAGSLASGDFAPTGPQKEVQALLHAEVLAARAKVDQLLQREVSAFNELLRRRNLQNVIATERR